MAKLKLIENWKPIAAKAHSMWAFYASVICLILPDLIYVALAVDTNPRLWWCLGLALLIYGIIGRIWDQAIDDDQTNSPWILGVIALAGVFAMTTGDWRERAASPPAVVTAEDDFMAIAIPFIGRWEGLRLDAYLDIVGVPTVCYGETKGVQIGDSYTQAECDAMFAGELMSYRAGVGAYLTDDTLAQRYPVRRDVAFTSLAYNVGVSGAGGSTAVKRLNAGNIAGACEALTWWNKAGSRVIRGLVNRRAEERDLCLAGSA